MAVMEVELPSGYLADVDALPSITRAKVVKRIDTANADSTVVIYFDRVSRERKQRRKSKLLFFYENKTT